MIGTQEYSEKNDESQDEIGFCFVRHGFLFFILIGLQTTNKVQIYEYAKIIIAILFAHLYICMNL